MDWATVASVVFGGVITLVVAAAFHLVAGRQLRQEAGRLHRLLIVLIRALEESKAIEVTWNADHSEPKGIVVHVELHGRSDASGDLQKAKIPGHGSTVRPER